MKYVHECVVCVVHVLCCVCMCVYVCGVDGGGGDEMVNDSAAV